MADQLSTWMSGRNLRPDAKTARDDRMVLSGSGPQGHDQKIDDIGYGIGKLASHGNGAGPERAIATLLLGAEASRWPCVDEREVRPHRRIAPGRQFSQHQPHADGLEGLLLYGLGTYTCDLQALGTADEAEKEQARSLHQIKACLGEGWAEVADRSSSSYVVLHQCYMAHFHHAEHGSNRQEGTCHPSHTLSSTKLGAGMTASIATLRETLPILHPH